jgi:hypothetical protein
VRPAAVRSASPAARVAPAVAGCVLLAALSTLLPAAPGYDAWAWLSWGREVAHLELSTHHGPAFKPLPVAVCALLSPLGDAAPAAWLAVARAGALAAVALAAVLAAELCPGPRLRPLAGAVAALGVVLTGGFVRHAAAGDSEPLLLALALAALHRHRAGRPGQALALGAAAALVRVEAWPYLAAYGGLVARRHAGLRPAVAALAVGVPAAWLLPELAGSGELLRSGDRALVPNPGAPALADRPLAAALGAAAALLPVPLALAAVAARGRDALLPLAAGGAWCLLVAIMAEAGFSGEPRYALPGAALVAVSAGAGAARLAAAASGPTAARRATTARNAAGAGGAAAAVVPAAVVVAALVVPATVSGVRGLGELGPRLAAHARLVDDLAAAVERAGGADALLTCGRPAVGRYRGTLLAWYLGVEKRRVRADGGGADVAFRSRLTRSSPVAPAAPPGGRLLASHGRWRIEAACRREGQPPPAARRSTMRTRSTTGTRLTATMRSAGKAAVW